VEESDHIRALVLEVYAACIEARANELAEVVRLGTAKPAPPPSSTHGRGEVCAWGGRGGGFGSYPLGLCVHVSGRWPHKTPSPGHEGAAVAPPPVPWSVGVCVRGRGGAPSGIVVVIANHCVRGMASTEEQGLGRRLVQDGPSAPLGLVPLLSRESSDTNNFSDKK